MNLVPRSGRSLVVATVLALVCSVVSFADDSESPQQLTLADLAAYRAALSGKATGENATTSDLPVPVRFHDLWDRPAAFRGRRVTVHGRVERIFRQGPIGSFPALAEVWIVSPAGDPFCLIAPHESRIDISSVTDRGLEDHAASTPSPEPGQTVQFTGTFLKLVRYSGGDGPRLAPLVVGDHSPLPAQQSSDGNRTRLHSAEDDISAVLRSVDQRSKWVRTPVTWLLALILAVLAATGLAWQQMRAPVRRRMEMRRRIQKDRDDPDPLIEFLQPRDEL
jgi:hypothetical protein